MEKGNVLVIGNSGVGKSTLINAVLGEDVAVTGWGTEGTTSELKIHENENIPFRLIDTVGFEATFLKDQQAINSVKKWSKNCAKEGKEDHQINLIWFCVDGTRRKLFSRDLQVFLRATSMWKTVPIIVTITKSYSVKERAENIEMVKLAFTKQKNASRMPREIIPVVASIYEIDDAVFSPPSGITELIEKTNELMPEGIQAGENDLAQFKLTRKRALSQTVVAATTTAGAIVGAVPIPFADGAILSPIEVAMVNSLAQIYGVNKDEKSKLFFTSIVEVGTVGVAARAAISALKMIPGINLGASVLNAIIAGSIIAALGEGSIYVFEQIYLGNKSIEDIEWMKNLMESRFSSEFVKKVMKIAESLTETSDPKTIAKNCINIFKNK